MKMYTLSCKDMGISTCDFVGKGKTKEEAIKMASAHFMKAHPMEAKEATENMSKEEMNKMMLGKVKEEM